ncbi:Glycine cleavage T-protein [Macleaya cordata]|uniref:Glycine cleavage T-protein n=1 Tax=Macleaya cordata TaxID=56857 RepID=A0A200Q916_MACCD|nr:Glycine cleavage T-protein [Macleaya cordata]
MAANVIPFFVGFSSATTRNPNPRKKKSPWKKSQSHQPSSIDAFRNRNLSISTTTNLHNRFSSSPTAATTVTNASSHFEFDLSPPPIDHDLLDTMEDLGAKISEDGTVETFDNDDEAFNAATDNGVAVVDLTHFGRIRVTGEDRVQFLHNQSTANFECLREGQGCDTALVTPTARTIDIAHSWVMKNAITLVVSPVTCRSIIEMLTKYIFFADKVEIHDITKQTSFFALIGPKCNQVMEDLNLGDLIGQPYGTHKHYSVNGMPITVGVGNLISEEGFSLLSSPAAAGSVWKTLLRLGAIPIGANGWERLRIFQGRPAPEKELTNEFNVLEAGLWNAVSLNKGCYKGQETISRLVTYDGVKQRLWGLHLSAPTKPGSVITVDGRKVGKLTSYTTGRKESEHFGLGYIKRQAASAGDQVNVAEVVATVVDVPFLARQTPLSNKSPN